MWEKSLATVHFSKWVLIISLITLAIFSVGGRVIVANLQYFKTEIEQELSEYGITGVSLDSIEGGWQGFHPLLKIKGASLSIPGRSQALSIDKMELSVKLIPSLYTGDLKLASFNTTIEKLILVLDPQGAWWLNDIPLSTRSINSQNPLDIYALFKQLPDAVSVDIGLLQIRDQMNDSEYLIQQGSLKSSRRNEQLKLSLLANLPESLGRQFKLLLHDDEDNQQVFIEAEKLNLVSIFALAGYPDTVLRQARFSLKSWIELNHYRIKKVQNEATLAQVLLNPEESIDPGQELRAKIHQKIEQQQNKWRFDSRVDQLAKGSKLFTGFNSQIYIAPESAPLFWVDRINLHEMIEILQPLINSEQLLLALQELQPKAELSSLVAELDQDDLKLSTFGFNFNNYQNKTFQSYPGVDNLDGQVVYAKNNARVLLDSKDLHLDFASFFRTPLKLDHFSTSLNLSNSKNGLAVQVDSFDFKNSDIQMQGRAWLESMPGKLPFLWLRSDYSEGKAAATATYLPVAIMPKNTVTWLDDSIRGGEISSGDLLFHGRLQKISKLEQDSSGEFHARFKVENPEVRFLPDWPTAREGKGLASFHNTSMDLSFANVQFASSRVKQVDLSIPNLLKSELYIKASTQTKTDSLIDTLSALPVLDLFDEIKNRTKRTEGEVEGVVQLRIPLSSKVKNKLSIKVKADLLDVGLTIPEWMVDFHKTNGQLVVNNKRVDATGLTTLYRGDKAKLDINSDSKNNMTSFNLKGTLTSSSLASLLPDYLRQPISGRSGWDILVDIANKTSPEKPAVKIKASSNLQGTEFNFPRPFLVDKDQQQEFQFTAELYTNDRFEFNSTLDDLLVAQGEINLSGNKSSTISAINIGFGADSIISKEQGVHLKGNIDELNLNDWSRYFDTYLSGVDVNSSAVLSQLQVLNLSINQLTLGQQQLLDTKIILNNDGQDISGSIDSSNAMGLIKIPYEMGPGQPFEADLEFLRLYKSKVDNKFDPEIEDMPNLIIESKEVSYEDLVFSDLTLKTKSEEDEFIIEQLDFRRDQVQLKSSGHWHFDRNSNDNVSVFNIDIKGEKFGEVVNELGLGETIRGGKIDFNGQIGWGGSLYDINWPTLIGEVRLNLEDGYLRNVDPGAGRFVGLLSFNALPKRLFLDFGDVVLEGMQFDNIKGRFSIKGETMYTDNASMKGSSAKIKMIGSTNLRQKTYDQSMIIIPRVGDTLPVIGTLAAGSSVGWGLLLLQKIFKKPIDKSVEIEYKVSGSWEQPEITLISKPEPEDKPEQDDIFGNENR